MIFNAKAAASSQPTQPSEQPASKSAAKQASHQPSQLTSHPVKPASQASQAKPASQGSQARHPASQATSQPSSQQGSQPSIQGSSQPAMTAAVPKSTQKVDLICASEVRFQGPKHGPRFGSESGCFCVTVTKYCSPERRSYGKEKKSMEGGK